MKSATDERRHALGRRLLLILGLLLAVALCSLSMNVRLVPKTNVHGRIQSIDGERTAKNHTTMKTNNYQVSSSFPNAAVHTVSTGHEDYLAAITGEIHSGVKYLDDDNNNNNNNKPHHQKEQPRLLLAIFGVQGHQPNRRMRLIVRHSYLEYYTMIQPNLKATYKKENYANLTICSLSDFWNSTKTLTTASTTTDVRTDCDIAYTLIVPKSHKPSVLDMKRYGLNKDDVKRPIPKTSIRLAWLHQVYNTNYTKVTSYFTHVALTDAQVMLYPNRLWPHGILSSVPLLPDHVDNNKFWRIDSGDNGDMTFSCLVEESGNDSISTSKTTTTTTCTSDRFAILSMPLVDRVVTTFEPKILQGPKALKNVSLLEVASLLNATQLPLAASTTKSISSSHQTVVHLLDPKKDESSMHYKFLDLWSTYQSSLVEYPTISIPSSMRYSNNNSNYHHPRMLIGIFSVLGNELETTRRDLLRRTFLSYYQNSTTTPDRICSLAKFVQNYDEIIQSDQDNDNNNKKCQLLYTFVVGDSYDGYTTVPGNNTSPFSESLVEDYWNNNNDDTVDTNEVPLVATIPSQTFKQDIGTASEPDDTVYLNIQENMKKGKSQSWFFYASRGISTRTTSLPPIAFDYIAKMDTDTLLYPDILLDAVMGKELPGALPNNAQVYGGDMQVKAYDDTTAQRMVSGPYYMKGAFYFLSYDLARYISSKDCPRTFWAVNSEDLSMGNFVHSYHLPIRYHKLNRRNEESLRYQVHPIKELDKYETAWKEYYYSSKQNNN